MRNPWRRRILFFAAGVGLFVLVRALWGEQGVRGGRVAAIAVLGVGFLVLAAVFFFTRKRPASTDASSIARLIRIGQVDEAVKTGRALFEKTPADPHIAWYYTAALMKSGHVAEARRVFATMRVEDLPPKMAAMHADVKRALEGNAPRTG